MSILYNDSIVFQHIPVIFVAKMTHIELGTLYVQNQHLTPQTSVLVGNGTDLAADSWKVENQLRDLPFGMGLPFTCVLSEARR